MLMIERETLKLRLKKLFRRKVFKGWKVVDDGGGVLEVVYRDEENKESPPIMMYSNGQMSIDCDLGEVGTFTFTPKQMVLLASVYEK